MPVFSSSVAFFVVYLSDGDRLETLVILWFYLAIYFKFNSLLSILDEGLYLILLELELIIASIIFSELVGLLKASQTALLRARFSLLSQQWASSRKIQ